MKVVVVSNDGRKNQFENVSQQDVRDIHLAVAQGIGFVVGDSRMTVSYGPGTVQRVVSDSK